MQGWIHAIQRAEKLQAITTLHEVWISSDGLDLDDARITHAHCKAGCEMLALARTKLAN